MLTNEMSQGLILLAHGARDAAWAAPFEAVAAQVRQRQAGVAVRLAYLEFMPPALFDAGAELAAHGCTRVAVLPLFLGAGGHVRKDVPAQLARLTQAYPAVAWRLAGAVGEDAGVIRAMTDAACNAVGSAP